jgi:diguanylate cyclase (GGDEF)-like protein/PAS domain S-box-containing protein
MPLLPVLSPATVQDLFRHLPEAVVVADLERRMTYVNPAAEDLFGYDSADLLGKQTAILYAKQADFDTLGEKRFNSTVPTGAATYRVTYMRRDGTAFLGETIGSAIHSADGDVQGYVVIIKVASAMEQVVDVLHRLHGITTDSSLSFPQRMAAIMRLGARHYGLPLAIQSRVDGDVYTVERCMDPAGQLQPGTTFPLDGTYCTHTLQAGIPTGFHHASKSRIREHPCYRSFGLEAYLGCPIEVDGECYGTLNFSRFEACRPFTNDDLVLIELLAHWVGHAIAQEGHRAELERLATTDALTGLLNRRGILEDLRWQLAHAERSKLPLSVLMCDVDHFKRVNDVWGHDTGDDVLRSVAEACQFVKRQTDRCGRLGGEEFLFVLPDTDEAGAYRFAERLLQSFGAYAVMAKGSVPITVTASIGVATAEPGEGVEGLTTRADKAMYVAKEEGRAQVRLAS